MKLNAVGVTTSDFKKTLSFYSLLGFKFPKTKDNNHVETAITDTSAKLMIDSKEVVKNIIGEEPKPGNHSMFAIEYENGKEIDNISNKVKESGFTIVKEPWDAFLGSKVCSFRRS